MFLQCVNCVFIHIVIICLMGNTAASQRMFNESADLETRIVGGKPVLVESYPASVKFYNFGALCSGTILNSWCVLTAAHCFDYNKVVDDMIIEVGTRYLNDHSGAVYDVLKFVIHEEYNKAIQFACDVALIFVTKEIKLGKKAKKALLVNTNKWMNSNQTDIVVAGWGWTKYGGELSQKGLLETQLSFISLDDCERLHQMRFTPDMFCLYGGGTRDTCKGDSGSGVLWNKMVIGVVSHGDGCAKKDKPSVYANVWYLRGWIQQQVEYFIENFCKKNVTN